MVSIAVVVKYVAVPQVNSLREACLKVHQENGWVSHKQSYYYCARSTPYLTGQYYSMCAAVMDRS